MHNIVKRTMFIAWYITLYKRDRREGAPDPSRYCAMDDFTKEIICQDGGNWSEIEIGGNQAVVKVRASKETLDKLDKEFNRLEECPDDAFFVANPRLKPRYDAETDTIILDGPVQPMKSVDTLNEGVK